MQCDFEAPYYLVGNMEVSWNSSSPCWTATLAPSMTSMLVVRTVVFPFLVLGGGRVWGCITTCLTSVSRHELKVATCLLVYITSDSECILHSLNLDEPLANPDLAHIRSPRAMLLTRNIFCIHHLIQQKTEMGLGPLLLCRSNLEITGTVDLFLTY